MAFQTYFRKKEEAASHFKNLLASQLGLLGKARMRCVAQLTDLGWLNVVTLVHVFPQGQEPKSVKSWGYPTFRLLEKWLELDELEALVALGESREIDFDGFGLKSDGGFHQAQLLPSENQYSVLPGFLYEKSRNGHNPITSDPLYSFEEQFFPNGNEAIRNWIGVGEQNAMFGSNIAGAFMIFVPECRARLESIIVRDKKIIVRTSLTQGVPTDLRIKGGWVLAGAHQQYDHPFQEELLLAVPEGAETLQIYLLGKGVLYDYHDEMPYRPRTRKRVLGGLLGKPGLERAVTAIKTGEGKTIEFKPFIEPSHPKGDEIAETVIAFSNSVGGVLLIGVNKNCRPIGIERDIHERARKASASFEDEFENYKGWIKRLIGDKISKSVVLGFDEARVDNHLILVLEVPEGKEKPYANAETNQIYIRRSSNNVIPDPETELPALFKKDQGPGYQQLGLRI